SEAKSLTPWLRSNQSRKAKRSAGLKWYTSGASSPLAGANRPLLACYGRPCNSPTNSWPPSAPSLDRSRTTDRTPGVDELRPKLVAREALICRTRRVTSSITFLDALDDPFRRRLRMGIQQSLPAHELVRRHSRGHLEPGLRPS